MLQNTYRKLSHVWHLVTDPTTQQQAFLSAAGPQPRQLFVKEDSLMFLGFNSHFITLCPKYLGCAMLEETKSSTTKHLTDWLMMLAQAVIQAVVLIWILQDI